MIQSLHSSLCNNLKEIGYAGGYIYNTKSLMGVRNNEVADENRDRC
jgi:hypothetical protein